MELSHTLIDAIWRPSFVLKYPALKADFHANRASDVTDGDIDALGDIKHYVSNIWRVDGATICGTQFFVTPIRAFSKLQPNRIDVFIPDQSLHPPRLRTLLSSNLAVVLRDGAVLSRLPISRYICKVLDSWCAHNESFLREYSNLPFGTKIVLESIGPDSSAVEVSLIYGHDLERSAASLRDLQSQWSSSLRAEEWPTTVDLNTLQLVEQVHDSVSLVECDDLSAAGRRRLIFKSNTSDFAHLYHELRFLLTTATHPNIMDRPLHVVTKRSCFGHKRLVIGFLLPYYPAGSLRTLLPTQLRAGNHNFKQQAGWCIQVTSALLHVLDQAQTFYSDLRPDNVIITSTDTGSPNQVKLCDFEQRGNWYEWCPPEILYRQYAQNLVSNSGAEYAARELVSTLCTRYLSRDRPKDIKISTEVYNKNQAWFDLPSANREKSMVYSLGLFIYCVFECLPNCTVSIANMYLGQPDLEFPDFRICPPAIQDIIKRCTATGVANEVGRTIAAHFGPSSTVKKVVRRDLLLYRQGMNNQDVEQLTMDERLQMILDTSNDYWLCELHKTEMFLQSSEVLDDAFQSGRPSLREVLGLLKSFREEEYAEIP